MGTPFQFPFMIEQNNLNIIQQGESFELRINNQVFSHLWQQGFYKCKCQIIIIFIKKKEQNQNLFLMKNLTLKMKKMLRKCSFNLIVF